MAGQTYFPRATQVIPCGVCAIRARQAGAEPGNCPDILEASGTVRLVPEDQAEADRHGPGYHVYECSNHGCWVARPDGTRPPHNLFDGLELDTYEAAWDRLSLEEQRDDAARFTAEHAKAHPVVWCSVCVEGDERAGDVAYPAEVVVIGLSAARVGSTDNTVGLYCEACYLNGPPEWHAGRVIARLPQPDPEVLAAARIGLQAEKMANWRNDAVARERASQMTCQQHPHRVEIDGPLVRVHCEPVRVAQLPCDICEGLAEGPLTHIVTEHDLGCEAGQHFSVCARCLSDATFPYRVV